MSDGPSSGAERIAAAFATAREEGRAALMPYMMGGFPDRDASSEIAAAYAGSGADLIELGVPFSDPLADGPVIHAAATSALSAGATLDSVLELCSEVGGRLPVVLMIYANMVLAGGGAEEFSSRAREAGAAGAIIPDLPVDEANDVREALEAQGLAAVPLVAPTTPDDRLRLICEAASGFVYVVSTVGTTGEREQVPEELEGLVARVREAASVPAAVGFGIGTPEQAAAVGRIADGVIIGSRLVRLAEEEGPAALAGFLEQTREALAGSRSG
jgi:tryptophan synthase alpha chain